MATKKNYQFYPVFNGVKIEEKTGNCREYLEVTYSHDKKLKIEEWHYRLLYNLEDSLARWVHNPTDYISEKALTDAIKECKRQHAKMVKEIKLGQKHPIFEILKPIAESTLKHFREDFYHWDALRIQQNNPTKFVWIISESHTHLLDNNNRWNRGVIEYTEKQTNDTVYIYDKGKLVKSTIQTAKHFLQTEFEYVD